MFKRILAISVVLFSAQSYAHCPASFKPESICIMLDQNILYLYDHKSDHNGPYKDFISASIESVKSNDKTVKFSKSDRGIYKLESSEKLKSIDLLVLNGKEKINIKVKAE